MHSQIFKQEKDKGASQMATREAGGILPASPTMRAGRPLSFLAFGISGIIFAAGTCLAEPPEPLAEYLLDKIPDDGVGREIQQVEENGRTRLVWNGDSVVEIFRDDLRFRGSFTITLWEKHSLGKENWQSLVNSQDGSSYGFGLDISEGHLYSLQINGLEPSAVIAGNSTVPDDTWRFVSGVYDAETGKILLYVNGVEVASADIQGSPIPSKRNMHVGALLLDLKQGNDSIYGQNLNGSVANLRFYDVALSATDIEKVMLETDPEKPGLSSREPALPGAYFLSLADIHWDTTKATAAVAPTRGQVEGTSSNTTLQHERLQVRVDQTKEGTNFVMTGPPREAKVSSWKGVVTSPDIAEFEYIFLKYRAKGLLLADPAYSVVDVTGLDTKGRRASESILGVGQLSRDGLSHLLVIKKKDLAQITGINITFRSDYSQAAFQLEQIGLARNLAELTAAFPAGKESLVKEGAAAFSPVSLGSLLNSSLTDFLKQLLLRPKDPVLVDPLFVKDGETVEIRGIPFQIGAEGRSLATSAEDRSVNDEKRVFLGQAIPRRSFFPVSRDDALVVPIHAKAREVELLLTAQLPTTETRYALPPGHFGTEDVEEFVVDVAYDDGTVFQSFPYSYDDEGYRIRRALGVYAVPADPDKTIKEIRLRNRVFGKQVGLVALTLNQGMPLMPATLIDPGQSPKVTVLPEPAGPAVPSVRKTGQKIELNNRYYSVLLDCSDGFRIERMVNQYSENGAIPCGPESGIRVQLGDRILSGKDFAVSEIKVSETAATIRMASKVPEIPIKMDLEFRVGNSANLELHLTAINEGAASFRGAITFPYLDDTQIGDEQTSWLFFPQYRNVWTNRDCTLLATNDRAFSFQFFDFYNAKTGIGLSLMTQNREFMPIDYSLQKSGDKISAGVIYPEGFEWLKPGESRTFPAAQMGFHTGDWKQPMENYRQWIASWQPQNIGKDREWLRKVFLFRSHIQSETESASINHTLPLFDEKQNSFHRIDEVLSMDKQYYGGYYPDAFHFYNWFYSDELKQELWGDYDEESYKQVGGLSVFREAIRTIQEDYKIPVSLYLIPDRISKNTKAGREIGRQVASLRKDGTIEEDANAFYVWSGAEVWTNRFAGTVNRVQKQTGAKIMYLDVFGVYRRAESFSADHGPHVPQWANLATNQMGMKVREELPDDVAIYSEYHIDDVNNQYLDGFLTYTWQPLHEYLQKSYDVLDSAPKEAPFAPDIYRFVFPRMTQWGWAVGMEGPDRSWLKVLFFQGIYMFDATWRLYPTRTMDMLKKSNRLRHEFSDCFTSYEADTIVPTEMASVYANRFPGSGRTLWTIFNARYQTAAGPVLKIPHLDGATYRDVWNGKSIEAEIKNGEAILSISLEPQGLGCVVQEFPKK